MSVPVWFPWHFMFSMSILQIIHPSHLLVSGCMVFSETVEGACAAQSLVPSASGGWLHLMHVSGLNDREARGQRAVPWRCVLFLPSREQVNLKEPGDLITLS